MVSQIKSGDLILNSKILIKIADKISNEVAGEWLIFGGSSLYLLGIDSRGTIDVDIASFQISTNEDTLKLMTIAESLNLPVETINQAGSFFLNKIENWQSRCQLFKKGKIGKVYIPSLDLYIGLKASRMSESDLSDCIAYLNWSENKKVQIDLDPTIETLRKIILSANPEQKKRIQILVERLLDSH